MFHTGTVVRFDVSHQYCREIRLFHTGTVERFDVSHWYEEI